MEKIKIKVLQEDRCLNCGVVQQYIIRDINVNPDVDDTTVSRISHERVGKIELRYCETCLKPTAFQNVSWNY
jgi:hypothetical protein